MSVRLTSKKKRVTPVATDKAQSSNYSTHSIYKEKKSVRLCFHSTLSLFSLFLCLFAQSQFKKKNVNKNGEIKTDETLHEPQKKKEKKK